jgi:hypothetical protein
MRVNRDSVLFNPNQILSIEGTLGGRYVCETCLKGPHGWINQPFALFWQDVPHPQGSNYFAMYYKWMGGAFDNLALMITDGISAAQDSFSGVSHNDGEIYFSRYRHDYREIPGGFVDGGRDYMRYSPTPGTKIHTLKIIDGHIGVKVDDIDNYKPSSRITHQQKLLTCEKSSA